MIIILKKDADQKQVEGLLGWLRERHITPNVSTGERETLIGCIGDVAKMACIRTCGKQERRNYYVREQRVHNASKPFKLSGFMG